MHWDHVHSFIFPHVGKHLAFSFETFFEFRLRDLELFLVKEKSIFISEKLSLCYKYIII